MITDPDKLHRECMAPPLVLRFVLAMGVPVEFPLGARRYSAPHGSPLTVAGRELRLTSAEISN